MIRLCTIILISFMLGGCISFESRKAYFNSENARVLSVKLVLPTGERFMNPHGFAWTPKLNQYTVMIKKSDNVVQKDGFAIIVNGKDLSILSGTIEVEYVDSSCNIIIDIVPAKEEHLLINGSHEIEVCDGT